MVKLILHQMIFRQLKMFNNYQLEMKKALGLRMKICWLYLMNSNFSTILTYFNISQLSLLIIKYPNSLLLMKVNKFQLSRRRGILTNSSKVNKILQKLVYYLDMHSNNLNGIPFVILTACSRNLISNQIEQQTMLQH